MKSFKPSLALVGELLGLISSVLRNSVVTLVDSNLNFWL